ncbi:MAG: hypothetical protein ACRDBG_25885 [Waterburya sp.]
MDYCKLAGTRYYLHGGGTFSLYHNENPRVTLIERPYSTAMIQIPKSGVDPRARTKRSID